MTQNVQSTAAIDDAITNAEQAAAQAQLQGLSPVAAVLPLLTRAVVDAIGSAREQRVQVTRFNATGTGNISGATVGLDAIGLTADQWRLAFVRVHFAGTTFNADLEISLNSGLGSGYDAKLFVVENTGVLSSGLGDVFLRVTEEEARNWIFQSDDKLVLDWTDPSSGGITWGVEVGIVPA